MKQNFMSCSIALNRGSKKPMISLGLKFLALSLLFFISSTLGAQTEIQTTITTFFNDVIIPVGGVLVAVGTFCGLVYSAMLFSQGSPNAKKVLIGVIVGAIVFYGGGLLLVNLFANFGSSYTIAAIQSIPTDILNLPALV